MEAGHRQSFGPAIGAARRRLDVLPVGPGAGVEQNADEREVDHAVGTHAVGHVAQQPVEFAAAVHAAGLEVPPAAVERDLQLGIAAAGGLGHLARGGVGLVSYSRKEGRALGEVTKFLVYNARKRQVGGDTADQYFARTECVAGVQDMRFQELMPDVLHWLGIRKIHRLVSMSNMKYDAITGSGIEVGERVDIPDALIPADARVEMDAKKAAGYFTPGVVPDAEMLKQAKGRAL